MKKKTINFYRLVQEADKEFINDNAIKLSASLSYYTIFSFAPLLIVIMSLAGFFFGAEAVQGKIYWQIHNLVGSDAAVQIQEIIQNVKTSRHTTVGTIIGVIALL